MNEARCRARIAFRRLALTAAATCTQIQLEFCDKLAHVKEPPPHRAVAGAPGLRVGFHPRGGQIQGSPTRSCDTACDLFATASEPLPLFPVTLSTRKIT
jgi:hypothetical protein